MAAAAAGLVLVGVFALGGRVGDPFGRGQGGGADSGRHGGGLFAQNAAHQAPTGQPPVTDLKVDRLRDAFNQAAGEPRIILSLSPT